MEAGVAPSLAVGVAGRASHVMVILEADRKQAVAWSKAGPHLQRMATSDFHLLARIYLPRVPKWTYQMWIGRLKYMSLWETFHLQAIRNTFPRGADRHGPQEGQ